MQGIQRLCFYSGGQKREIAGEDLRGLVEQARLIKMQLQGLATRVPLTIVEQAAILGALECRYSVGSGTGGGGGRVYCQTAGRP